MPLGREIGRFASDFCCVNTGIDRQCPSGRWGAGRLYLQGPYKAPDSAQPFRAARPAADQEIGNRNRAMKANFYLNYRPFARAAVGYYLNGKINIRASGKA